MRSIRKSVMMLMMGLLALPLAAQGPMPQQAERDAPAETAPAAPQATQQGVALDRADVEAWLDGFMPYALERGGIAGAVVVVVRGDGPVLEKGYGYADVESRKRVSPDATLFRPGSVSKLLTWTAVMQLVEAGKLDLDQDVNAYLDFEIPPYEGKPITLRHIMTHTAGFEESIRHLISADPKAVMPLGEYVKTALPERVFAPGTTPAYSNYATALAGYIVERASGMSFDDYIDRRVFAPTQMTRSTFRQPLPDRLKPLMSSGYAVASGETKPFEIVIPAPAGSLSATGADMGRFMMAHLNDGGALLQPATAQMMHDTNAPRLGKLNTMALGFYEQWVNGRRAIAHGGDTEWFHSYLWLFPDADIGLYISMNSQGKEGAAGAVRSALFHKFADRYLPGDVRQGRVDDETARQHAQMMAGNYVSSRGAFTSFVSLLGLLGQPTIGVDEKGRLAIPMLDGLAAGARNWVEVEPFVWVDTGTGEQLAAEVRDGRVVRVSTDAISPFMMLEPASFGYNAAFWLPALMLALAIVALAAIAWPVRAVVRRRFGATLPLTQRGRLAYRVSRGFAWGALAVVAGWMGLIAAFSADIGALGGRLDWLLTLLRIATPIVAIGLTAAAGWNLWLIVKEKRSWTAKVGGVLLLLAALVLLWVTFAYHLYGFGMIY